MLTGPVVPFMIGEGYRVRGGGISTHGQLTARFPAKSSAARNLSPPRTTTLRHHHDNSPARGNPPSTTRRISVINVVGRRRPDLCRIACG